MSFNNSQTHPLIKKVPNYFMDCKHISIHSEDRDRTVWRDPNNFEIQLPDVFKNVQSIHLKDLYLPINNASDSNSVENRDQTHVYIELEKFNSIDELEPNPSNTNATKQNRAGGRVNSSFAVVPIVPYSSDNIYTCDGGDFASLSYFNPPIEKVSKLKFKFRFHDGRLVDFGDKELQLTLVFNMLINEHEYKFNINTPGGNYV